MLREKENNLFYVKLNVFSFSWSTFQVCRIHKWPWRMVSFNEAKIIGISKSSSTRCVNFIKPLNHIFRLVKDVWIALYCSISSGYNYDIQRIYVSLSVRWSQLSPRRIKKIILDTSLALNPKNGIILVSFVKFL